MNESSFLGLIHNATLLLAMAFLFDLVALRWRTARAGVWQIPYGLVIGGIGIILMLTPWVLIPGIIFDTRSVLLSISGLFFGAVPTLIAMGMMAAFRIYQGGIGIVMGVSVIMTSGMIGIAWRLRRRQPLDKITAIELYLLGIVVHIVMLALVVTLPWEDVFQVLSSISLPVMVIYPLGTTLLGVLMVNRLHREQTAKMLWESQERLRLAVSASNIGFFDRDLLTHQVNFSPEWKSQIGYAADEIKEDISEWESRIHPDDLPEVLEREQEYINGFTPNYEAEYRLRHKDGSYRWILARGIVLKDPDGQAIRMLGCHIDITQQKQNELAISRDIAALKQAEQALKKSEEKYRVLTENIKDVVWILDVDTMYFRYVSPSVQSLRGYTAEEILAMPLDYALTTETREESTNFIRSRAADFLSGKKPPGTFYTEEMEQPCKDGSTVWTEVITTYYLNDETGHVEVRGVSRDIAERKRAEEKGQATQIELQRLVDEADHSRLVLLSLLEDQKLAEGHIHQLNVELEQRVRERTVQLEAANKELEAFAYSVSHDLRAPLRAMDGFSAALLSDYPDRLDEKGRHYLERIQEASRRMGQLINDLLKLSRVTRTDFNRQPVNLSIVAQQINTNLKAQEPQRQVECEIYPDLIVQGDVQLLKIVMENLLSNAYKFSSPREVAQIQVGVIEKAGERVFFVRDNGVGFDMEYAGKLFAPFQRLHSMQEFPGTGIGLVTVQRIIHRHGGRVWPESVLNQGTTFYFTLGGE